MVNDKWPMPWIDLHTHSSYSDGSFSPRQLVELAKARGLRAIGLTDHDTVAGIGEALAAGKELDIEVVPGLEISAAHSPGTMHILGYYICDTDSKLIRALKRLRQARAGRNPKILGRLRTLGFEITMDEVLAVSGGQVGRPHIARALVNRGYVSSISEAFARYLKKGAPAYVERFRFPPQQAIAMIRQAGGLAVLAHPFTLGIDKPEELARVLLELQTMGLEGLEVFYPEHSQEMTRVYEKIARQLGLLCTGGSDFHGDLKNGPYLGDAGQGQGLSYALLERVKQRLKKGSSGFCLDTN